MSSSSLSRRGSFGPYRFEAVVLDGVLESIAVTTTITEAADEVRRLQKLIPIEDWGA